MAGFTVVAVDAVPSVPSSDPGDPDWKPIQHHLGLTAFGLNVFRARAAGDELAGDHDERGSGQEEVYLVLAGRARFRIGGEDVEVPAGSLVAIRDPALSRSADALEPGTTVLAVGVAPGSFRTTWEAHHFTAVPRHPTVDDDGR